MESKGLNDTKIKKEPKQRPKKRYKKQKTKALYIRPFVSFRDEAYNQALNDFKNYKVEDLRKAYFYYKKRSRAYNDLRTQGIIHAIAQIGKSK